MALDVIKNMIEWDMFKNMIFVNKISDTWESPLIGLWDFLNMIQLYSYAVDFMKQYLILI